MHRIIKENRGLTLVELLVALAISSVIVAALYRTFLGQQKTYTVQEQVVDMRQSVRGAISNMMRELRMTGFGAVGMVMPITLGSGGSAVTYQNLVNRPLTPTGWITIVTALTSSSRGATLTVPSSTTKIIVSSLADFDTDKKKYISIGGVESNTITSINTGTGELTLKERLLYKHSAGIRIYPIRAISYYAGLRNENTGDGAQVTAENIESTQFEYLDAQGNTVASDAAVQMIRLRVTAKTDVADPQLGKGGGDGYRRREISSNIQLRNVTLSP